VNKATELLSKMNKSSMKSRVGATYTGVLILSHSITICIYYIIFSQLIRLVYWLIYSCKINQIIIIEFFIFIDIFREYFNNFFRILFN